MLSAVRSFGDRPAFARFQKSSLGEYQLLSPWWVRLLGRALEAFSKPFRTVVLFALLTAGVVLVPVIALALAPDPPTDLVATAGPRSRSWRHSRGARPRGARLTTTASTRPQLSTDRAEWLARPPTSRSPSPMGSAGCPTSTWCRQSTQTTRSRSSWGRLIPLRHFGRRILTGRLPSTP